MALSDEILKLAPSGMVELFEIDFTPLGGTLVRFCNGKNFNNQDVIWKGNVYQARAIEAKGFHRDAQGRIPRPKVTMSNVAGIVTELIKSLGGDVTGVRFTRRRTLIKFLDAANFVGNVNPDADPTQEFPQETWVVDRKSLETKQVIEFELSSPFDRPGSFLPARQIIPNCCNWVYRKEGCGYTGGPVADEKDVPTSDPDKDKCSHSLVGCKLRYGEDGVLPYGGEPTAGAYR